MSEAPFTCGDCPVWQPDTEGAPVGTCKLLGLVASRIHPCHSRRVAAMQRLIRERNIAEAEHRRVRLHERGDH